MNRTAAIEYSWHPDNYDCEGILEHLADEYETLDMNMIEYAAKREAARIYSISPYKDSLIL